MVQIKDSVLRDSVPERPFPHASHRLRIRMMPTGGPVWRGGPDDGAGKDVRTAFWMPDDDSGCQ